MHRNLEDNRHELAAANLAEQIRKVENTLGTGYPGIYEKYIMLGRLYLAVDDFDSAKHAFSNALTNYEQGVIKDDDAKSGILAGLKRAEEMIKKEKISKVGSSN